MPDPRQTSSTSQVPFKVKICGVRSQRDVQACVDASADCIGLNFYPPSVRYLDPADSQTLAINDLAVREGLYRVGLFVNEPLDRVFEIGHQFSLDAVQFHGDETRAEITQTLQAGFAVMRAIRLPTSPTSADDIQAHMETLIDLPITFLLDADVGAAFGGGGKQLHWPSLAAWAKRHAADCQNGWVLAGGLDAECVGQAKRDSGAASVDVASGVEATRGQKSADLIQKFVTASRLGGVDETD